MKDIIIAPSILSADFVNLQRDVEKIEKAGADWVHIDVMDGIFVPNITIGIPVVKAVREITKLPLDVHLMIDRPERYIRHFAQAGSDIITVHSEACEKPLLEIIDEIKSYNVKAGVSIKPNTPFSAIKDIISHVDLVLVMTVEPGFGGQGFIEACLPKIEEIKSFIDESNLTHIDIEVDGGINKITAQKAKQAGANALVAGSYVYGAEDIPAAIQSLK